MSRFASSPDADLRHRLTESKRLSTQLHKQNARAGARIDSARRHLAAATGDANIEKENRNRGGRTSVLYPPEIAQRHALAALHKRATSASIAAKRRRSQSHHDVEAGQRNKEMLFSLDCDNGMEKRRSPSKHRASPRKDKLSLNSVVYHAKHEVSREWLYRIDGDGDTLANDSLLQDPSQLDRWQLASAPRPRSNSLGRGEGERRRQIWTIEYMVREPTHNQPHALQQQTSVRHVVVDETERESALSYLERAMARHSSRQGDDTVEQRSVNDVNNGLFVSGESPEKRLAEWRPRELQQAVGWVEKDAAGYAIPQSPARTARTEERGGDEAAAPPPLALEPIATSTPTKRAWKAVSIHATPISIAQRRQTTRPDVSPVRGRLQETPILQWTPVRRALHSPSTTTPTRAPPPDRFFTPMSRVRPMRHGIKADNGEGQTHRRSSFGLQYTTPMGGVNRGDGGHDGSISGDLLDNSHGGSLVQLNHSMNRSLRMLDDLAGRLERNMNDLKIGIDGLKEGEDEEKDGRQERTVDANRRWSSPPRARSIDGLLDFDMDASRHSHSLPAQMWRMSGGGLWRADGPLAGRSDLRSSPIEGEQQALEQGMENEEPNEGVSLGRALSCQLSAQLNLAETNDAAHAHLDRMDKGVGRVVLQATSNQQPQREMGKAGGKGATVKEEPPSRAASAASSHPSTTSTYHAQTREEREARSQCVIELAQLMSKVVAASKEVAQLEESFHSLFGGEMASFRIARCREEAANTEQTLRAHISQYKKRFTSAAIPTFNDFMRAIDRERRFVVDLQMEKSREKEEWRKKGEDEARERELQRQFDEEFADQMAASNALKVLSVSGSARESLSGRRSSIVSVSGRRSSRGATPVFGPSLDKSVDTTGESGRLSLLRGELDEKRHIADELNKEIGRRTPTHAPPPPTNALPTGEQPVVTLEEASVRNQIHAYDAYIHEAQQAIKKMDRIDADEQGKGVEAETKSRQLSQRVSPAVSGCGAYEEEEEEVTPRAASVGKLSVGSLSPPRPSLARAAVDSSLPASLPVIERLDLSGIGDDSAPDDMPSPLAASDDDIGSYEPSSSPSGGSSALSMGTLDRSIHDTTPVMRGVKLTVGGAGAESSRVEQCVSGMERERLKEMEAPAADDLNQSISSIYTDVQSHMSESEDAETDYEEASESTGREWAESAEAEPVGDGVVDDTVTVRTPVGTPRSSIDELEVSSPVEAVSETVGMAETVEQREQREQEEFERDFLTEDEGEGEGKVEEQEQWQMQALMDEQDRTLFFTPQAALSPGMTAHEQMSPTPNLARLVQQSEEREEGTVEEEEQLSSVRSSATTPIPEEEREQREQAEFEQLETQITEVSASRDGVDVESSVLDDSLPAVRTAARFTLDDTADLMSPEKKEPKEEGEQTRGREKMDTAVELDDTLQPVSTAARFTLDDTIDPISPRKEDLEKKHAGKEKRVEESVLVDKCLPVPPATAPAPAPAQFSLDDTADLMASPRKEEHTEKTPIQHSATADVGVDDTLALSKQPVKQFSLDESLLNDSVAAEERPVSARSMTRFSARMRTPSPRTPTASPRVSLRNRVADELASAILNHSVSSVLDESLSSYLHVAPPPAPKEYGKPASPLYTSTPLADSAAVYVHTSPTLPPRTHNDKDLLDESDYDLLDVSAPKSMFSGNLSFELRDVSGPRVEEEMEDEEDTVLSARTETASARTPSPSHWLDGEEQERVVDALAEAAWQRRADADWRTLMLTLPPCLPPAEDDDQDAHRLLLWACVCALAGEMFAPLPHLNPNHLFSHLVRRFSLPPSSLSVWQKLAKEHILYASPEKTRHQKHMNAWRGQVEEEETAVVTLVASTPFVHDRRDNVDRLAARLAQDLAEDAFDEAIEERI